MQTHFKIVAAMLGLTALASAAYARPTIEIRTTSEALAIAASELNHHKGRKAQTERRKQQGLSAARPSSKAKPPSFPYEEALPDTSPSDIRELKPKNQIDI